MNQKDGQLAKKVEKIKNYKTETTEKTINRILKKLKKKELKLSELTLELENKTFQLIATQRSTNLLFKISKKLKMIYFRLKKSGTN